MIKIALQICTW